MTLSRFSLCTTSYYTMYYEMKKVYLKEKYYEKKERSARNEELYEKYGGEKNYYKLKLKELGVFGENNLFSNIKDGQSRD